MLARCPVVARSAPPSACRSAASRPARPPGRHGDRRHRFIVGNNVGLDAQYILGQGGRTPAACGDGFVQMGVEGCDDANDINEDACTAACELAACGDGFVQMGVEACDDANAIDDDECTNACTLASCGDGILQQGEECDDAIDDDCVGCQIPIDPGTSGTTGDDTTGAPDSTTSTTSSDTGDTGDDPTTSTTGDDTEGTGGNSGGNSGGSTGDLPTGDGPTGPGAESTGEDAGSSGSDSSGVSGDDGCGCASNGPSGGLWALLALVGIRRRRTTTARE